MSILEILVLFLRFRNLLFMPPSSSLQTLQHGLLILDLSWLLSSSSAQHKLYLPHLFLPPQTIFWIHFPVWEEGPRHCLSSLGGSEVWTTDSMYCVGRCTKEERFKPRNPSGREGKVRCERGISRNLTSHLEPILKRDFQVNLTPWILGNFKGKIPHHAVTVVALSINDSSSPTPSCRTGISPTLRTATIFAAWKRANNISYHTPQGLNSLGP